MASQLAKIVADFRTTLATEIAVGGTTGTLQSVTDSDGNTIPNGIHFLTLDGDGTQKEYIKCTVTGTALTNIRTINRQGTQASGTVRKHRIGAKVQITNFAHIKYMLDLLDGTTDFDAATPLSYDGVASLTPGSNEFCTVAYADALTFAGAPNGSTTQKGIFEEATLAEVDTGDAAGGTSARLVVNPSTLHQSRVTNNYAADVGSTDTYAITSTVPLATLVVGKEITFKANTRNTGACTLNVDALGAVSIKKDVDQDLATGDIKANQIVKVVYDGANFQLIQNTGLMCTGGIIAFGGASAPAGFLLCDGTAVSRTTYAALFAVLSTTYGVGDGSTTFNLPNAKGRMIVGLDSAQTEFDTLAETGGAKTVTLTGAELPAHTHTLSGRVPTSGSGESHIQRTVANVGTDAAATTITGSTGSGSAFSILNPYLVVNYIIKI